MTARARTERGWRAPDLLLSLAGHAVLIGIAVLLSVGHAVKDTRRPIVFNVAVVSPGTPLPKTEPKKGSNVVKRQGLGARIEGAEALGYSYYLNVILSRISDNWLNPYAGEAKILNATVMFVIERDGTVRDVKIEKKSGDGAYDASCERALLVLDRLPPLPPEFTGPRLKLHLEFEQKP